MVAELGSSGGSGQTLPGLPSSYWCLQEYLELPGLQMPTPSLLSHGISLCGSSCPPLFLYEQQSLFPNYVHL